MSKQRTYDVILIAQPEGGFTAAVPELPDVTTEGETKAEALLMAKDAIKGYLETMRANHWSVPHVSRHIVRVQT
ncbi:MAG: type II toxin-antitoxin system HicB family antitoxin [Actinomycetota bacterium]